MTSVASLFTLFPTGHSLCFSVFKDKILRVWAPNPFFSPHVTSVVFYGPTFSLLLTRGALDFFVFEETFSMSGAYHVVVSNICWHVWID